MSPARVFALLLSLTMFAAACTGGGEDPADGASDGASAADAAEEVASAGQDNGAPGGDLAIPLAPGAQVDVDDDILQAAQTWIAEESGLSAMLQEEIFLSSVTQTQDVLHLTYIQQHDEVTVRGAQFIVHIRQDGDVVGASQSLTTVLPGADTAVELDQLAAADTAAKAVPGEVEGEPEVQATWLETGTELRLGWEVLVVTRNPTNNYAVIVDATTGEVLSVDRLGSDQANSCQPPAPPSACIFVVDPIYASGNPAIDPADANATLVGVPLANLINPSDGNLVGRYAQIAPRLAAVYNDPDNVFGQAGRGGQDITFEAGMTYYWIDYTQAVIQGLGYDYHASDPVDFVPIEPDFPDNAFYLFTEDRIHMGDAPDGVREAEDAQGIIHEYGHAMLQAAIPNIVSEEGGAFHEGFADLVSVFTTLEFRNGDIGCLFHWAERGRCIRRIDTDLVYPTDLRFEVHLDAEILTGAVWDIFEGVLARDTGLVPGDCQDRSTNPCDAVRDEVYGTLLGSLPFLTPVLTLNDAAAAFAASDQTFYGGRNSDIIQQTFTAHGLTGQGSSGVQIMMAGDLMDLDRSNAQVALKIVHEFRGDLQVDVGVVDPAGTLLCELNLIAPDGQDGGDNVTGRFDLTGTDCEAQLPPSPERLWAVRVRDAFELDEGTLFQFSVSFNGQRFVAPGLPLAIPDADPQGIFAVIGGELDPAVQPMAEETPAAAADGSVQADIAITHPYIGDLSVQVAVVDPTTSLVQCRVDVLTPDPQDSGDDLNQTVDLGACASFYPPDAGRVWLLRVIDTAAQDVGQVTAFTLRGPDGVTREGRVPVDIPDDDPAGALVLAP